jgi:NAD(P)-dependent dehydrogenase (short-subunit alcohol dehydrogenase family)
MSLDLFRLDGRAALVTGGSKGLGRTFGHALASAGADIILNSRNQAEIEATANDIANASGRRVVGIQADVTRSEEVERLVESARKEFGRIDILVNNAGINIRKTTLDISMDEWHQVVDTNLTGPFLVTKHVVPLMLERGWGRVIHVASMLGQVGLVGRPAYTSTKGALVMLTKTQALEWAKRGVTVNALCPGPFDTPMNREVSKDPEKFKEFIAKIPMGRWGRLEELHGVIIFLASEASSFMTGTTLTVDGGWTAQ